MIKAILQLSDGLPSGRIWLRSVVRTVQKALLAGGIPVEVDGRFGSGTRSAIREFQRHHELDDTGIFDAHSWLAAADLIELSTREETERVAAHLDAFRGDLGWVHEREGHRGRPYWPGGASGVTRDPGVDLGHAAPEHIVELYGPFLTPDELAALRLVFGIRGAHARTELNASQALQALRLSAEQALEILPPGAAPYWDRICLRFEPLRNPSTPPSVQTAMLSLSYNRGPSNPHLESLGPLLEVGDWSGAAAKIRSMQQGHSLEGIRIRRRHEGQLIQAELDLLASS